MSYAEQVRALRRAGKHEEACSLAVSLAAASPEDAELQYEAACVHDYLGREAQAVPFYLAALPATYLIQRKSGSGVSAKVDGLPCWRPVAAQIPPLRSQFLRH
jgi:hypothetical protein